MSALSKISLLGLAVVGAGTLHGFGISTGFYDMVNMHKAKGVLPDGSLYDPSITGVAALDDFLGTLVQFFWPCVDGSAPGLTLQTAMFGGQILSFLVIWLVEGHRNGNKGKFISYITPYGLLFQAAGLGVMSPIWMLASVFTSPTVTSPTPSNLSVDPAVLSGIPIAMLLGAVPATTFMSLPAPSVISIATKIKALAIWQPMPMYITAILRLWTMLSGSSSPKTTTQREQMQKLRSVYKLGLALAVPIHAATWGVSFLALVLPQIFTPSIATAFHPLASLIPANPLSYATTQVSSMAQGSLSFLQWDYLVSSSAYLVYSLSARFTARVEPKGFSAMDAAGLVARIGVLGPMGAALAYMWERDEIVFAKEEGQKKLR